MSPVPEGQTGDDWEPSKNSNGLAETGVLCREEYVLIFLVKAV